MKVTVSLTRREADEILRCQLRDMGDRHWASRRTRAQETALFKLREAVITASGEGRAR